MGGEGEFALALYYLDVHYVQRSKGRSSVAAAAYRSGEKIRDERTGTNWDYTRKTDIEHKEVLVPDGLPSWLQDRSTLWNTVEEQLNRKDGQPAFEVRVALPRELSHDQNVQLAREFAEDQFVSKGLVVDLCMHRSKASDGGDHPHAHMLITTRRFNPDGTLGKAARDLQDKPHFIRRIQWLESEGRFEEAAQMLEKEDAKHLRGWRKDWADYSNRFLELAGSAARIDHRTLEAQKIDREPVPNISYGFHRGFDSVFERFAGRVKAFKDVSWRNDVVRQFARLQDKRPDRFSEYVAVAREWARDLIKGMEPEKGADYER